VQNKNIYLYLVQRDFSFGTYLKSLISMPELKEHLGRTLSSNKISLQNNENTATIEKE